MDFKNVQRRVYDALNVLNAMDIIRKDRNHIFFNPDNLIIPGSPPDLEAHDEEIEDPYYSKEMRETNEIVSHFTSLISAFLYIGFT